MKIVFPLLLIFLASCGHIQSGKYIKVKKNDTVDSLAKEFRIPHAALLNANRERTFSPGNWVFIPQDRGFLQKMLGTSPVYGQGDFSRETFFKDPFLWPVPASKKISSTFGIERWGKVHQGIDIPATSGSYVLASDDGVVTSTEYDSNGYGKMILVKHKSGLESLYGHLRKRLVTTGQKVYRGQIIGFIGSTGKSTGPHLHFEVRKRGDALNPLLYVSQN